MLNLETFGTRDGYGDYLWDRVLFLLAPGSILFLIALAFALKHFTPPPLNGGTEPSSLSQAAAPAQPHDSHDHP